MARAPASAAKERLDFETFLERFPAAEAARLRTEAAQIDELDRYAIPVRGIEERLWRPFLVTVVMFATGLAIILLGEGLLQFARAWVGRTGLMVLLGALPGLGAYYAFRVRWRTKADKLAFDLNKEHFLPHGAVYFPPAEPGEVPSVVIVDEAAAYRPKPSKYDKVRPGPLW